ncbi:MAG: nitronate monooxygenase [Acidimicrobiales bacterium]
MTYPRIIQGGMGIGVSDWRLAGAVGCAGGLGVVSGVALDSMLARRLQDGDEDGQLRQALAHFPVPEIAEKVLNRYLLRGGRPADQPYRLVPRLSLQPSLDRLRLTVVAAFAEVHLARQAARGARVGINFLEKIQLATPAAAYGALLAGVDVVLVGAGIPARLPALLDHLSVHEKVEFPVDVAGAGQSRHAISFDPVAVLGRALGAVVRPLFLAIVSSNALATYLARDKQTRPDGFVVEGGIAGGHNAPPRGALQLDRRGDPVYGPRDVPDTAGFAELGLPFWLAGGYSRPDRVAAAIGVGARGVQVGTLFALSRDSNLSESLRSQLLTALDEGHTEVRTDARASPTGFPFKVTQLAGTLSEAGVYEHRARICDLSYLRVPYTKPDGTIGYRCPAEPVDAYLRKGGERSETVGRVCLCNALMAAVGLGQRRDDGPEPAISTLGADLDGARALLRRHPGGWGAADVIAYLNGA